MTKQSALLASLESGESFTFKEMQRKFGLKNPCSTISNLRSQGYCIYANDAVVNGTRVVKYRLGQPTRRMISIANRVAGASVFTR